MGAFDELDFKNDSMGRCRTAVPTPDTDALVSSQRKSGVNEESSFTPTTPPSSLFPLTRTRTPLPVGGLAAGTCMGVPTPPYRSALCADRLI